MNVRRLEIALVALAMMMIVVASYQLFVAPAGRSASDASWRAWLGSLENSAKHRRADELVWRDLYQGERLSDGASVFTGTDSRAEIKFREGQELQLAANTLLRIQSLDLSSVLVEKGFVRTQLGKTALRLEMNGKNVELSGDGAELQIVSDGTTAALSVVKGRALLTEGTERFELAQNDEAQVSVGQATTAAALRYELRAPVAGAVVWGRERTPVEFSWDNRHGEAVRLRLARDLKLTDLVADEELVATARAIELSAGTYYWQVTSALGRSRLGNFTVKRESPLAIAYPENGATIALPLTDEATWPVTLRWSGSQVKAYQVSWETATQSETIEVTEPQATVRAPVDAPVRWRVRPVDPARPLALPSEEASFTVKRLLPPSAVQWVTRGPLVISRADDEASSDVAWTGAGERFDWELRQASTVRDAGSTSAQELRLPLRDAGEYQVVVRAVDQFGRAGVWSEPLAIKWRPFEARPPEEGQRIVLESPDQKISFSWDGVEEQLFELAEDSGFAKVLVSQRGVGAAEVVFPQVGTFFWRARRVLPDGTSVYSAPKKVVVEPTPPLPTPEPPPALKKEIEIQFTAPKSTWVDWVLPRAFASEYQTRVTLELPTTGAARKYRVEIFSDEALTRLVFATTTTNPAFEWKGAQPGRYWWRYALVDAWERQTAMSPASPLDLVAGAPPKPERAKLLKPIRSTKLAEAEVVEFQWTAAERALRYELEVASDDDFETILQREQLRATTFRAATTGWPRGQLLFWRVRARHDWGEALSNVGRFQLGEPKVLTAEEKQALPWRSAEPYSWLQLGVDPRTTAVTLDDREFSGELSGTVLNAVSLTGRLQRRKWSGQAQLVRQSGKVFESEPYSRLEVTALVERHWRISERSFVWLGAGASRASLSSYRLATPTRVALEEDLSSIAPRIQSEWEWRGTETSSLHVQASLQTGDWSGYQVQASWRRFLRHQVFVEGGAVVEAMQLKASRGTHTYAGQGLNARAGLSF